MGNSWATPLEMFWMAVSFSQEELLYQTLLSVLTLPLEVIALSKVERVPVQRALNHIQVG
jgi:hypothetical protein